VLSPVSPEIVVDSSSVLPASGLGNSDGGAEIFISGGTGTLAVAWFFEDEWVADGTIVSNLNPGIYTLLITDTLGCTSSDTLQIGISSGQSEANLEQNIVIFPNPVLDELTIMHPLNQFVSRVDCINPTGRIIMSRRDITNSHPIKFQKSELGVEYSGIYLIRLWIGDMPIYKKIMVLNSND
jgi:hypothetical protein